VGIVEGVCREETVRVKERGIVEVDCTLREVRVVVASVTRLQMGVNVSALQESADEAVT
jgi:hypothetical protein